MPDDVFEAISHPTRRAIVKALGDRGHMTFTELMDAAGVKDTGTMTFHLRRLSQLITRNSSGEYELTELGRRAYEAIRLVEGASSQPQQAAAGEGQRGAAGEGGLMVISNRLYADITRELLEDARARGRRVLVSNCLLVRVADDVDEGLVREALEGVRGALELEAPKSLAGALEDRVSDVFLVSYRRHVKTSSRDAYGGWLSWLGSALRISPRLASDKGYEVYSTAVKAVRSIRLDLRNSILTLGQGDGRVAVRSWGGCEHDVRVKDDELIVEADGCYVEASVPPGASALSLDAEDSEVKVSYGGLSSLDVELLESSLSASLDDVRGITAKLDLTDGAADVNMSYGELSGESRISVNAEGSRLSLVASVKGRARVTPTIRESESSTVNVNVDPSLAGGEGLIAFEVSADNSDVRAEFRRA